MTGEGTPVPASEGDTVRVTFDSANEQELVFPAGVETSSIIIQAHPNNSDLIYVKLTGGDDQAESLVLEAGDSLGIDIDVSANPIYAEALNTADELRAGWIE